MAPDPLSIVICLVNGLQGAKERAAQPYKKSLRSATLSNYRLLLEPLAKHGQNNVPHHYYILAQNRTKKQKYRS